MFSAALTNVEDILQLKNKWKKEELEKLSKIVQDKIHGIQVANFYDIIYVSKYLKFFIIYVVKLIRILLHKCTCKDTL